MPNLTPFEIALLVLGAVLVAALGAILWWHLAGVVAFLERAQACSIVKFSHSFSFRWLLVVAVSE